MPPTGIPIVDWILAAMDAWGYLIVIAFTVFENLFVVGSLTPGETAVIVGGFVASRGGLALPAVWLASVAGTLVGTNISYQLGRRAGLEGVRAFVDRFAATWLGRLLRIDPESVEEVQQHFDDHGSKTVLLARFAAGAKNFVPAMAGATRMKIFWFEFYSVVGAVIYSSLMCALGWFLGTNIEVALKVAGSIGWVGLGVLLAFLGVLVVGRRFRTGPTRKVVEAVEEEVAAMEATEVPDDTSAVADARE